MLSKCGRLPRATSWGAAAPATVCAASSSHASLNAVSLMPTSKSGRAASAVVTPAERGIQTCYCVAQRIGGRHGAKALLIDIATSSASDTREETLGHQQCRNMVVRREPVRDVVPRRQVESYGKNTLDDQQQPTTYLRTTATANTRRVLANVSIHVETHMSLVEVA
jgi:hypothetical protein